MRHLHKSLSVLFVGALLLAGCAGAPETPSSAPRATPPPQPSQPPPAGTQQPEPAVSVEGMTIFEMQERLNELGYKLGTVDGVSGPRTVEALKKFQSDNKLPPTGTIDAETIRKLRSAK
jgi:peptidoglycan hydrolase-like protein with peptidoglycan-binding domain